MEIFMKTWTELTEFQNGREDIFNHGWERYTRIRRERILGLIRCASAGSVAEKTLASALADAFSQHLPTWRPSATRCFFLFSTSCAKRKKQGHLRSRMSDGVLQSRASSLAKGFESASPAWLAQAQPCASLPIRVNPSSVVPKMILPKWSLRGQE